MTLDAVNALIATEAAPYVILSPAKPSHAHRNVIALIGKRIMDGPRESWKQHAAAVSISELEFELADDPEMIVRERVKEAVAALDKALTAT